MFKDHELIGIPHRIVVSDRGLDDGMIEYKGRTDKEAQQIPIDNLVDFIEETIKNSKSN